MFFEAHSNFPQTSTIFGLPVLNCGLAFKMADMLVLFSAFVVVLAFLFLGVFISRLGVLERQALMGAPVRSVNEIPSASIVGVRNPFVVKLAENRTWQDGKNSKKFRIKRLFSYEDSFLI